MTARTFRWLLEALVVAGIVTIGARIAGAQQLTGSRAAVVSGRAVSTTLDWDSAASPPVHASARLRALAPLASAAVPGAGQFILGDDRFIAYAAVEILGLLKFVKDAREQRAQEASFRGLARRVARAAYSPNPPDGNWTYYEAMRDFLSSGQYTTATDGSVVPPSDPNTFNGHQWLLAQRTTPDSAAALAQYARMAYKSDYEWSWDNAQLQWDIFKRTTFKRDDAHYAGVQDLIVIGANHFLSMVDAFATFRLTVRTDDGGRTAVGASFRW